MRFASGRSPQVSRISAWARSAACRRSRLRPVDDLFAMVTKGRPSPPPPAAPRPSGLRLRLRPASSALRVSARPSRVSWSWSFTGAAVTAWRLPCNRCLRPRRQPRETSSSRRRRPLGSVRSAVSARVDSPSNLRHSVHQLGDHQDQAASGHGDCGHRSDDRRQLGPGGDGAEGGQGQSGQQERPPGDQRRSSQGW